MSRSVGEFPKHGIPISLALMGGLAVFIASVRPLLGMPILTR